MVQKTKSAPETSSKSSLVRWKYYSWLLGRAWNLEILHSRQGWDFSMLVYAVLYPDSLIVKYTESGDIDGLQRLFSIGEASPNMICLQHRYSRDSTRFDGEYYERGTLLQVLLIILLLYCVHTEYLGCCTLWSAPTF